MKSKRTNVPNFFICNRKFHFPNTKSAKFQANQNKQKINVPKSFEMFEDEHSNMHPSSGEGSENCCLPTASKTALSPERPADNLKNNNLAQKKLKRSRRKH